VTEPPLRRVGMLAPMEIELAPLTRELDLVHDGELHHGKAGDVEVVALVTTMGMTAGELAARRLIDIGVDRVIVVGIAGGVDASTVKIGEVVIPEVVIDRRTGKSHGPPLSPHAPPRGTISCGDELITDPARLAEMGANGITAVDMETAAVAAVCEAAGVPWSAFRGISDYASEGLVDQELFEATNPDGTADRDAITRYLEAHPEKVEVLQRLAQDTKIATEAAAAAAIRSCSPT
jgi:adenosylhomocysteine nucleosidase